MVCASSATSKAVTSLLNIVMGKGNRTDSATAASGISREASSRYHLASPLAVAIAAARAAQIATATIPIVMIAIGDPVGAGLVRSLARPGGNITGNTLLGTEMNAKRVELLRELVPSISRVAFLWNPNNASHRPYLVEWRAVAPKLGIESAFVEVGSLDQLERAFAAMMREHCDAVSVTADPFHLSHIDWIIDYVANNRLPTIYVARENAAAGGLISYGPNLPRFVLAGRRIRAQDFTRDWSPASLPVEQAGQNLTWLSISRPLRRFGLNVPQRLLCIHEADEVDRMTWLCKKLKNKKLARIIFSEINCNQDPFRTSAAFSRLLDRGTAVRQVVKAILTDWN